MRGKIDLDIHFGLGLVIAALLSPLPAPAQSDTLSLDRVEITWAGRTASYTPGASNILEVEATPSVLTRTGTYRAIVSYNKSTPAAGTIFCYGKDNVPENHHEGEITVRSVPGTAHSSTAVPVPSGEFVIEQPPRETLPLRTVEYRFYCELNRSGSPSIPSGEIVVRQNLLIRQSLSVVSVTPDSTQRLPANSLQTFRVTADWEENSIFYWRLRLTAYDAAGASLGTTAAANRGAVNSQPVTKGRTEVTLSNLRIPATPGRITLRLQMTEEGPINGQNINRVWKTAPDIVFESGPPPNPHQPAQPTDSRFVATSGTGLKSPCTPNATGPRRIILPVARVAGLVDATGELMDPQALINAGVLTAWARLRLAVLNAGAATARALHKVRLNGIDIDYKGAAAQQEAGAGAYALLTIDFPIWAVRFPARQGPRQPPTPRDNEILIETQSGSNQNACVEVDWAELSFGAMAPLILIHGNGQGDDDEGGKFWEGEVLESAGKPREKLPQKFTAGLEHIPYDNSISMRTANIPDHAALLATLIPEIAASFGARHAHLVAHSKGGLDSRAFLAETIPPNFGVLSLITLSTPHRGSPGPDYQIDSAGASVYYSGNRTRTLLGQQVPPNAGTYSLRVSFVEAFNQQNLPLLPAQLTVDGETAPVLYRAVSADMNLDGSSNFAGWPTISHDETIGLGQNGYGDTTWTEIVETVYRLLGEVHHTAAATKTSMIIPP